VFNNIFVAVNTVPGSDKPISFLPKVDLAAGNSHDAATDGNCFFRTGQYHSAPLLLVRHNGASASFATLEDYRGPPAPSPHFTGSQTVYGPGFEASSIETDPQLDSAGNLGIWLTTVTQEASLAGICVSREILRSA
jgi:hypothetical protein